MDLRKKAEVSTQRAETLDPEKERRNTINSVAQALKALDYLEECGGEAGVVEIGDALGVHKSTASRLLATMNSKGYVARNEITQKYSLGIRILELARSKLDGYDLRTYARPFLEELSQKTQETIHLAVIDQNKLLYVDKVDSLQTLAMRSSIGNELPFHCTALGKAILAALDDEKRDAMLNMGLLQDFTASTINDPVELKEHLDMVRSRGFAVDDQEHEEGIRCVASVVWDYKGEIAGAISVSGPALRISGERVNEMGALVKDVCQRLSKSLGSPDDV